MVSAKKRHTPMPIQLPRSATLCGPGILWRYDSDSQRSMERRVTVAVRAARSTLIGGFGACLRDGKNQVTRFRDVSEKSDFAGQLRPERGSAPRARRLRAL